ncbi:hypothetical protein D6833_10945 [Candidatus Parcubacteria bacterium]|nr:MAG: hypothetical protein D6833_10945 [Candidatus Parcubacteria bacterium]
MPKKKKEPVVSSVAVPPYFDQIARDYCAKTGLSFTRFVYHCAEEYSEFMRSHNLSIRNNLASKHAITNDPERTKKILARIHARRDKINLSRFLSDAITYWAIRYLLSSSTGRKKSTRARNRKRTASATTLARGNKTKGESNDKE